MSFHIHACQHTMRLRQSLALTALVATSFLAACTDATTAPVTPDGTWVVVTANARALPAVIHDVTYPDDGTHVQVFVTVDTITIAAGSYRQRGSTFAESNGVRIGTQLVSDHGLVTRNGDALHFESNYYQNVAFDGAVHADGSLVVVQDIAAQGSSASYLLRKE